MSEIPIGNPRRSGMTRRGFLRAAALSPFALLAVNEGSHEATLAEKGTFETPEAFWYPLYERHDQHEKILSPSRIPTNLNAISLEGISSTTTAVKGNNIKYNDLQVNIFTLLGSNITGYDTPIPNTHLKIPVQTLEYLKQKEIPVCFGDVTYDTNDLSIEKTMKLREQIGENLSKAGGVITTAGQVLKSKQIDRRGFLRLTGLASVLAGAGAYLPARFRLDIQRRLMDAIQNGSPAERLWARLSTVSSNLMPEYLNDLFRELMQANKLFILAKNVKKTPNNQKPTLGYNWHLGHRGIEDWLRLGQNVTRSCILAFPDEVLKSVIKANNDDPRSLYAIRVVQVPKSLKIVAVDKSGTTTTYDDKEVVDDDIYEDTVLAQQLKLRKIY